jgi:hypothetical protein
MRIIGMRTAWMGSLLLLAGCAAQTPPVELTRFHLGQPIAPGEIMVEPRNPNDAKSLEFEAIAASVARELKARGFSIAPNLPRSELVAVIEIETATRQTGPERSTFSIGLGGGTYGGGVGVGGGVSLPVGKKITPRATRTGLFVQIKRRSDGTVIWEGRARLEARDGTPYASTTAAIDRLAAALFKDFPGESGRPIIVK